MEKEVENNKLIAVFMGRKIQTDNISWFDENYKPLKYDDWNTIMPVVEKIESLGGCVIIDDIDCEITYGGTYYESTNSMEECNFSTYQSSDTKLQAVYNAVVQFIQWCEDNNKTLKIFLK